MRCAPVVCLLPFLKGDSFPPHTLLSACLPSYPQMPIPRRHAESLRNHLDGIAHPSFAHAVDGDGHAAHNFRLRQPISALAHPTPAHAGEAGRQCQCVRNMWVDGCSISVNARNADHLWHTHL